MRLSSILERLNLRFLDIDTEEAYISLQKVLQRKLLVKIRTGLIIMLLASFIYSISEGHTAEEILLKAVLPTTIVFAGMFRDKFNNLNNSIFIIIYWIIGYLLPPRMLEFYEKENRIAMFFVGYFMGIVEVVVSFSIKDNFYRLLLQVMLVFGKLFNFSKYLSQEPIINVTLWTISFISIVFFFYHDGLDRLNFKTTHDVTKKLQKFQSYLADDFPVSVIMISAEVNSLIYSNLAFKHTFGDPYSAPNPERFIRETFRKLIIQLNATKTIEQEKEPRQSLFHYIKSLNNSRSANKENEVFNVYVTHKKEDEDTEIHFTEIHFEIKLKRITWENHPAFTIILNDVSDKQQILALKTADEQKDRVVATISHELKTPINGILGLLEIVSSQDQNETSQKYLEHCKSCSKLLLYFVNSVLDLSQLRKNQLQIEKSSFSLQALLEEIKSLYIFTSEHKGLDFIIEKGPLAPETIYTDRYRLAEVLMSLLSNAMKFTFAGHVRLRVTPEFAVYPRLVFYVEDSGVGIKEKEKRDLFQMFGKLPEADKNINLSGAGLGLSIANQLVKALNKRKSDAQISFESHPGKGSKFWFPVDISPDLGSSTGINEIQDQRPQQRLINSSVLGNSQEALSRNVLEHRVGFNVTSSRTSSLGTGAQDQQLRVLIVDDNPFNLIAASHITKRIGFVPETADTGKECLQILEKSRRNGQPFDLVLMDIQMPIMDGIETTQIINDKIKKGKLYYVPVVALTAKHVDQKERSNNLKSGLFDTLEKPLVESELRRVMRNIQENALSRNTTV